MKITPQSDTHNNATNFNFMAWKVSKKKIKNKKLATLTRRKDYVIWHRFTFLWNYIFRNNQLTLDEFRHIAEILLEIYEKLVKKKLLIGGKGPYRNIAYTWQ